MPKLCDPHNPCFEISNSSPPLSYVDQFWQLLRVFVLWLQTELVPFIVSTRSIQYTCYLCYQLFLKAFQSIIAWDTTGHTELQNKQNKHCWSITRFLTKSHHLNKLQKPTAEVHSINNNLRIVEIQQVLRS